MFPLGYVNGLHVIARMKIAGAHHAVIMIEEEQAVIGHEATSSITRRVILHLTTITRSNATIRWGTRLSNGCDGSLVATMGGKRTLGSWAQSDLRKLTVFTTPNGLCGMAASNRRYQRSIRLAPLRNG